MDPRTGGIISVFSRCTDPSLEGQLQGWSKARARRLLDAQIEGLVNVRQFEFRPFPLARAGLIWSPDDIARAQSGRYVTLYETSSADPHHVYESIRSVDEDSPGPDCEEIVHEGAYRLQTELHSPGFDPDAKNETNGILISIIHPLDRAAFEEWYVPVHLKDETLHGVHHSVARFLNVEPSDRAQSFAVLEAEYPEDIVEARTLVIKMSAPYWRFPEDLGQMFEMVWFGIYQRLF